MTEPYKYYEQLAKKTLEGLIKKDGIKDINISHDVKIMGKSEALHQIDVYCEYSLANLKHKLCVECKQYKNKVKKSDIAAFSSILKDIGNDTRGMFITTIGYQNGAILLAREEKIELCTLNNLIKEVNVDMRLTIRDTCITGIDIDKDCAKNLSKNSEQHELKIPITGDEDLYDSTGQRKGKLYNLVRNKFNAGSHELHPSDTYLKTEIGNIKVRTLKYKITHREMPTQFSVTINETAKAVIEYISKNEAYYLNNNDSVTNALEDF